MIDQAPRSPLLGRYLVQNRPLNGLLSLTDRLLAFFPRTTTKIPSPRRILLANGAHLGDVLLSLAVLPALRTRFPQARIGFLSGAWARCLLERHPLIDWIHHVDHWKLNRAPWPIGKKIRHYLHTRRNAVKEIRGNRYDLALDLYYYFPNAIPLLWQARIPCRLGYTSGGFGPLLTHALDWAPRPQHVIDYHADLLRFLGIAEENRSHLLPSLGAPCEPLPPWIREEMRSHQAPAVDFLIFHVGAGSTLKEWPLTSWRQLAQRMIAQGHTLVLTGSSPREQQQTTWLGAGLPRCLNLCGRMSWDEFVTVVRNARLLVGVDSVAAHVAAAVNTPCAVVSIGITNPALWTPRGSACRVLSSPVPCAPCYRSRGCEGMECVRQVGVEEVEKAILELLPTPLRQGA